MFLDAGGDGEDVRVEDDVLRRKAGLLGQEAIRALADFDLALEAIGLAALVKRHHHHRRAVPADQLRLAHKLLFAFLEADGVHDALALEALEAGLDDRPFRAVDHDRHTGDVRLRSDEIHEGRHGLLRIEHRFVHVHIDDLRAVLDLLFGDG